MSPWSLGPPLEQIHDSAMTCVKSQDKQQQNCYQKVDMSWPVGQGRAGCCVGGWCLPEFHLLVEGERWTPAAAGIISQVTRVIQSLSGYAGAHSRDIYWETAIARTFKALLEKGTWLPYQAAVLEVEAFCSHLEIQKQVKPPRHCEIAGLLLLADSDEFYSAVPWRCFPYVLTQRQQRDYLFQLGLTEQSAQISQLCPVQTWCSKSA